ncbi:hypothetical protein M413DRAFT_440674 [Hebeloma cylindrosporum]|uniref:Uncharacterized protein n=1 Tax=Hebeloma cylindrosporum TaxID=76867 RepID=A0A0C2YBH6_HEBCY|nr:hypothetical protein M413DRAFT_440674 [Hebeloma cylindrosporum h7]
MSLLPVFLWAYNLMAIFSKATTDMIGSVIIIQQVQQTRQGDHGQINDTSTGLKKSVSSAWAEYSFPNGCGLKST